MDNNDILIRLRYALDIKDVDMLKMFEIGGMKVSKEELKKLLIKTKTSYHLDASNIDDIDDMDEEENEGCSNKMLECFLNGFIVFKRGENKAADGTVIKKALTLKENVVVNNVLLKKVKIALELSGDDMMTIITKSGVTISKGELSAFFRKEGHKHYRTCGDHYARNFLKGLSMTYRKSS